MKSFLVTASQGSSLTGAALLGTGLTVLALSLGGIAGLSDDVRAASERHQQTERAPELYWKSVDAPRSTTPQNAPGVTYDQDGQPIVRGS